VEFEGGVEVSIVVGQVADVADLRLEVVARIGLVPARDRRDRLPAVVVQVAVDDDLALEPGDGDLVAALRRRRHGPGGGRRPQKKAREQTTNRATQQHRAVGRHQRIPVLRFVPGRHGSSQRTQPMTYNSGVPMEGEMRRTAAGFVALVLGCVVMVSNVVRSEAPDARLKGAMRRAPVNGWTYVRLEGTPAEIGFQNGPPPSSR